MQHKIKGLNHLFQNSAGVQMILRPGRVLERNPTTMEYYRYCISTMTIWVKQGKRPRNIRTLWKQLVSKIKIQTRAVAGTQCMNRWDEGCWDRIPLDTEGSPS